MNLTELKAAAYDAIANVEYWQKKLQEINQQIAEEANKKEEEK